MQRESGGGSLHNIVEQAVNGFECFADPSRNCSSHVVRNSDFIQSVSVAC